MWQFQSDDREIKGSVVRGLLFPLVIPCCFLDPHGSFNQVDWTHGFTFLIYHFIYCEHIEVLLLGTYPSLVWPTIGVDPRGGGYSVILGEGVPLGL